MSGAPCLACSAFTALISSLDHVLGVADDRHVGAAHLAELGRVDVDVDDLGVRREAVGIAGDAVVEARAEGDEQVGLLHRRDRGVVAVHARHAEAERVRVGDHAARHQRGDDGDVARARRARAARSVALALRMPPPA